MSLLTLLEQKWIPNCIHLFAVFFSTKSYIIALCKGPSGSCKDVRLVSAKEVSFSNKCLLLQRLRNLYLHMSFRLDNCFPTSSSHNKENGAFVHFLLH